MWRSLYEWRVWDELKSGSEVYALMLDAERPKLACLSDFTVAEVVEFQGKHKELMYFVEEKDGQTA